MAFKPIKDNPTREELDQLIGYLEANSVSTETKWAALFILRKTLRKPFQYDPNIPVVDQKAYIQYIRKAVAEYTAGGDAEPGRKVPRDPRAGPEGMHADFDK